MATDSGIRIRPLTVLLLVLAVLFAIAGVVYLTTAAKSLPSFFPGHDAHLTSKHIKHGLAMFMLAAVTLAGAWFTTTPDTTP